MLPLKAAYDRINADILNPLLADDEGRDPALGYDALEARPPTMEELLGIPPAANEADGLAPDAEPAADGPEEPLSVIEEAEEEIELESPQAAGGEEPRSSAFSPSSSELWPSDPGGTVTPIALPPPRHIRSTADCRNFVPSR